MKNNIIKSNSFVKSTKQKLVLNYTQKEDKEENFIYKNNVIKTTNNIKYIKDNIIEHQDYILDILEEMRNFDEKNGTNLFNNISYNDLNSFILKNNS